MTKIIITITLLLAVWTSFSFSQTFNFGGVQVFTNQGSAAVSSVVANTRGAERIACDVKFSGVATAELQCNLGFGSWRSIAGTSTSTDTLFTIQDYCTQVRSEVTAWTSGNVNVYCEWVY